MADMTEIDTLRPVARENVFNKTLSDDWLEEGRSLGWLTLFHHLDTPSPVRTRIKRAREITNPRWQGDFHPNWYAIEIETFMQPVTIPHKGTYEEALFWAIDSTGTKDYFILLTGIFRNVERSASIPNAYTAIPINATLLRQMDEETLNSMFRKHPNWHASTCRLLRYCGKSPLVTV